MLDILRKKAQSPYIQATVVIIILVFIFWGVGTNNGPGRDAVATVNDQPITLQEYQRAYDQTVSQYREQFGGSIPPNLLEALNLKQQVLNQLIEKSLVRQGAREMGLMVSNQEVNRAIHGMDVFTTNGVFDVQRYRQVLAASNLNPPDFEAGVRQDLLTQKVLAHINQFAQVTPAEVDNRLQYNLEEIKLGYAALKAAAFRDQVQLTPAELTSYYEEHKTNYQTPPQVKLQYLGFPADKQPQTDIPEERVQQYYQQNLEQFTTPETRRARHILLRVGEQASPEQLAAKRQQLENLRQRAETGEDFGTLARQYSEDGSASQGGDLGFFSRGQMVEAFENAVFSMQKGQLSDIVRTQFGLHLIRLEEIKPAQTKPLAEVRQQIEYQLQKEQAMASALKQANEAYEQIILSGGLSQYAEQTGADARETPFFSRQNPPTELAGRPAMLEAAFNLKEGELSSLVKTKAGYAILYAQKIKPPEVPPLEAVQERVRQDVTEERANSLAREAAQALLTKLRAGGDFNQILREQGLEPQQTDFISRRNPSAAGLPAPIVEQAFRLSAQQPYPAEAQPSQDGQTFYVFRFLEERQPPSEQLAQQKEAFKQQLLQEERLQLLGSWLESLKRKAEITTNQQYLS